jgi:alkylation response protein AidB-like acyl-CoA dehydrogenase
MTLDTTKRLTNPVAVAKSLSARIQNAADESERIATMHPDIVKALTESGLFAVFVPAELGGGNADIMTVVDVIEELSRSDASTGWSYMANVTSAGAFAGYCDDAAVKLIFGGSKPAITAGMLGPMGVAKPADGGYIVSGKYGFASGSGHANWIGGGAALDVDGEHQSLVYVVPRAAVEFLGNWDVLGLRGTGSYDYRVPERFVAEGFTFPRVGATALRGQPSLKLGLIASGVAGHLGVAMGTAKRALEELVKVLDAGKQRAGVPPIREQQLFLHDFAVNEAKYRSARAYAMETLNDAVNVVLAGNHPPDLAIQRIRQAATYSVKTAADVVGFCYTWSGSVGLRNPHPLGRLVRDMSAQTQHVLVDHNSLAMAGTSLMNAYR